MKLLFYFSVIAIVLSGCEFFSTGSIQSDLHLDPKEDRPYYLAVEEFTRSHQVYSAFETVYFINVTYFSEKFIDLFEIRKNNIFSNKVELFSMKKIKTQKTKRLFFVSLFGPEDDLVDIVNSKQWSIYIESENKKIFPTLVKKLDKRDSWNVFFPYINNWSREYMVFFEDEELDADARIRASNKTKTTLVLSNSQAKTVVNW